MWKIIFIFLISRLLVIFSLPVSKKIGIFFGYEVTELTWKGVNNPFLSNFTSFDSMYYIRIAQEGYSTYESTAFFPLYPILINTLSKVGISEALAGFIISNIAFLIGMLVLNKILEEKFNKDKYGLYLLCFSPITIYFMSVYTESLFFCLCILCFYYIDKKNWLISGIFAGLASLTRNSGTILFVSIFISLLLENKNFFKSLLIFVEKSFIGVLVFAIYPMFLYIRTGNPLQYIYIQSLFWHRQFTLPHKTIYLDIINLINNPSLYFIVFLNLLFLTIVIFMLFNYKKYRLDYIVFTLLSGFMPLFSPPYWHNIPYTTGLSRYLLVLFPIYIFIGYKIKNKIMRTILFEINLGIMFMFSIAVVGKQFIG